MQANIANTRIVVTMNEEIQDTLCGITQKICLISKVLFCFDVNDTQNNSSRCLVVKLQR